MADFIHRTSRGQDGKLLREFSAHTPDFVPPKSTDWILGPDLTLLEGVVDEIYWKTVGETVIESTQAEKDAIDQAIIDAQNQATADVLEENTRPHKDLDGTDWAVSASGLVITFDLDTLIVSDAITVTVDPALTTFAQACLVHNHTDDDYYMVVSERTNGIYDALPSEEHLVDILGEWSVVANGTDLVEVV